MRRQINHNEKKVTVIQALEQAYEIFVSSTMMRLVIGEDINISSIYIEAGWCLLFVGPRYRTCIEVGPRVLEY